MRDRGGDGLGAPGAGPLPSDRAGIERALGEARRAEQLHAAADRAGETHGAAWARLYRDPDGARRQFAGMQRSTVGPEIAADVLRRNPQTFGPLTEAARTGAAQQLARDVLTTGAQWQAAEGQRPRTPAAQVTAELGRLDRLLEPFRVQDRAQERARELARELTRGLGGLDRGGRGR